MKKLYSLLALTALGLLSWYFFFRAHEFDVKFKVKTTPGNIIQSLRLWDRSADSVQVILVDSTTKAATRVTWKGKTYIYTWNFSSVNDSTTKINVAISEPGREIQNKALIPFTTQPIESHAEEVANIFYQILKTHLQITKVRVLGPATTKNLFCACRTLATAQTEKANGMMKDYALVTSFIATYKLEPAGPPIVSVRDWSHTKNRLRFDFCFPIRKPEFLPTSDSISFKEFESQKALKAEYYGNYITSDRAWYELIQYAHKNNYVIQGNPIEYFNHNPNMGMNEEQWKAEVFLPIN